MNRSSFVIGKCLLAVLALGLASVAVPGCGKGNGGTQNGGQVNVGENGNGGGGTQPIVPPSDGVSTENLPPAGEVMTRGLDTLGGKAMFEAVGSMSLKGRVYTILGDGAIEIHVDNHRRMLLKNTLPGGAQNFVLYASDGTNYWTINPIEGKYKLVTEAYANEAARQFMYFWELNDLARKTKRMETVTREPFDNRQCYKVRVVHDTGHEEFWYFDAATGQPAGLRWTHHKYGEPTVITTTFSNFRPIEGFNIFTRIFIELRPNQAMDINLDEIVFNQTDPAVFGVPDAVTELIRSGVEPEAPKTAGR